MVLVRPMSCDVSRRFEASGETPMHTTSRIRLCACLPWLAVAALLLYLAGPSPTQPAPKPPAEKTSVPSSYDQISPALLGQESFQAMMAKDKAAKAAVMERQKKLLEERYDLTRK